jgi:hypothetical protein
METATARNLSLGSRGGKKEPDVRGYYVKDDGLLNFACQECGFRKPIPMKKGFGRAGRITCKCGTVQHFIPNRRKNPRKKVSFLGFINFGREGDVIVTDLSMGGANIATNGILATLEVNSEVRLTFYIANGGYKKEVILDAVVTSNNHNGHFGLKFVTLPEYSSAKKAIWFELELSRPAISTC